MNIRRSRIVDRRISARYRTVPGIAVGCGSPERVRRDLMMKD
jgi:hypothetical protein